MTSPRRALLVGIAALVLLASAFAVGRASRSEASDPAPSGLERVELSREAAPSSPDLKPVAALPALKVEKVQAEPTQVADEAPTVTDSTPETTVGPTAPPTNPNPTPPTVQPEQPDPFD